MRELVEVRQKDMKDDGSFPCPKCGVVLSPECTEEELELLDIDGECGANRLYSITVKHTCGQVIKIIFIEVWCGDGEERPGFYT